MAAFAAEADDFWPRHAAFAAPVFDPAAAAAGMIEPARVADYLGAVTASLSMRGATIAAEGAEVAMDSGEAELAPGRPARFAYDVSGVTMSAPGVPAAAPSSARVRIESAGRLDPATLLRRGFPGAVADAAPFSIEAGVASELGRVEGSGRVDFDPEAGPALLAAEATVATDDPVGYLRDVFLAPMAAQVGNPAAFEQAIAEVLAAQGWLPMQPGHEREYRVDFDRLSGAVTVEGQDAAALLGALNEACLRLGC
jgi:hypothetical protein